MHFKDLKLMFSLKDLTAYCICCDLASFMYLTTYKKLDIVCKILEVIRN